MKLIQFKRSVLAVLISGISFQALSAPYDQAYPPNEQGNADDPCARSTAQVTGAVLGALIGGFLGNKVGTGNGKKLATAVGVLGGLALGNYIGSELDRRKCEVSKIAKKNNLEVVMVDLSTPSEQSAGDSGASQSRANDRVGMSISIEDRPSANGVSDISGGDAMGNAASSTQFQSGSDTLNPQAEGYFREIAAEYALPFRADAIPQGSSQEQVTAVQGLRQKRLLILGHTDDTGNSRLNADLSEHRAKNVARLFGEAGVPVSQIFYQGSGETQPIADNRTEAGRAKNRRVEIVDLSDEAAFQKYLANRTTNANFYRVTSLPDTSTEAGASGEGKSLPKSVASDPAPKVVQSNPPAKAMPHTSAHSAKPAAAQGTPLASLTEANGYDFGGKPVGREMAALDIGKLVTPKSAFNLISSANAGDLPMARSCNDDRPRLSNAVKGLQSNQEYHVSEYLPNLYDTSWVDKVNGNLVALTHVAVLRDGASPAKKPTVLIYKASHGNPGANAKADYSALADVNTYQGEIGLLYRVFVDGPIKCMDIVIPRDKPDQAKNSSFYYQSGATRMVAAFNPQIAKSK
jgi:outer membrane protein OmpA-like peptidoglycan-associated protein